MRFTVKDKNNNKVFTGTKQECMHFIKRRAYKRSEVTIESYDNTPAPHYTVPVTAEEGTLADLKPQPKGFFKRIFK